MPLPTLRRLILQGLLAPAMACAAHAEPRCAAHAAPQVPLVVELYTSEGCSSCPPADRWLSGLKARPDAVALAFHVDYWDRLGWKDRFSSAAHSQRQAQLQRSSGARTVYTPQVVVDGLDQPGWHGLTLPAPADRPPATLHLRMTREGQAYMAEVRALPGAALRVAGYWALTEDGHASAVKSGENRGVTLPHDFVVRDYEPIAAWDARSQPALQLQFRPTRPVDPQHPRHVNLLLFDADSGHPLQALRLGC
jgi:hypothetical protein